MTAEFPALAAQNAPLLRAIAEGPCNSLTELSARSGVRVDNLNRKLDSLKQAALIASTGDKSHQVEVTDEAVRALKAIAVYEAGGDLFDAQPSPDLVVRLDPTLIDDNPFQPRTHYDAQADEEMALSVADKGVLQPIMVRRVGDRYQQALGHRRVRGVRIAIHRAWLAADYGVPAQVRDLSDDDMEEIALVENVQRSDLHWMDEAEAYLRLNTRPHNALSASGIKRLVGEKGRSKRSIQELIQYARELDADAKRRARLDDKLVNAEGKSSANPDHLSYEQCRFLVGNKKPKPALDLAPKSACALIELLDAGEAMEGQTGELAVRLHAKPTSPALVTLADKALVRYRVEGSTPVAVVQLSDEVAKFCADLGFHEDREACLAKVRAEVVGELAAGALAVDNRFVTAELNLPDPVAETQPTPPAVDPASHELGDLAHALHSGNTEQVQSYFGRQAATDREPAAEPAVTTAAKAEPAPIKPTLALAVIEIAHKLQRDGIARPSGLAVAIGPYHKDPLTQELVYARLAMFMPMSDGATVSLTPTAQAWLDTQGVERDGNGVALLSDEALQYKQAELGTQLPLSGSYLTDWLNTSADPAAEAPKPTTAERPAGVPKRDAFTQQILDLAADAAREAAEPEGEPTPEAIAMAASKLMQRLAYAARHAAELLASSRSKLKLKREDVDHALRLLEEPLAEAERLSQPVEANHAEA